MPQILSSDFNCIRKEVKVEIKQLTGKKKRPCLEHQDGKYTVLTVGKIEILHEKRMHTGFLHGKCLFHNFVLQTKHFHWFNCHSCLVKLSHLKNKHAQKTFTLHG